MRLATPTDEAGGPGRRFESLTRQSSAREPESYPKERNQEQRGVLVGDSLRIGGVDVGDGVRKASVGVRRALTLSAAACSFKIDWNGTDCQ